MANGRIERVKILFHQVADLAPSEQRAVLDDACSDDPGLRAAVEKLLAGDARFAADDTASGFLTSPLVRTPEEPATLAGSPPPGGGPRLPEKVGRYRILRLLGEGGMGTVYEAEQDNPRRVVALKVIRPGLVSATVLKRFAHEAQILGRLHHPGIAQIYEAGLAEDGQPFFALEFIRGKSLDEFARVERLDTPARLDLFALVCDAVQHAHDQGVIHRDLKPGNILVDESGQPKVVDFGVARVTDADRRTSLDRTRTGQLVGTLSYMSPEQVEADPAALDWRSDVYALGVILFELLAGRLPYPLEHLPLPEAARVIREKEPSRLGSIDLQFRGDIETIVAKALEKNRERRYPSAAELASDIRRHLRQEPIRARPPSALYNLGKFARRHKALVGGVAGIMAALVVGLVATILFAQAEAKQRRLAEHNARLANAEKAAALYQTYRARVAAATTALQSGDVADAARQLDEAPVVLRDWEWRHLSSRLDDSVVVLSTSPQPAHLVASSTPGPRLAIVAGDRIRLWDDEGRAARTLPFRAEEGALHSIVQSPDGSFVLCQHCAAGARLCDGTGAVRLRIPAPNDAAVSQMAFNSPRNLLAITWRSGDAYFTQLYDASGKECARLAGPESYRLRSIDFSPDGTRLVQASEEGMAWLYDTATGRPIFGPWRHTGRMKILHAAFCPDGRRVLTASADGTVCQWDTRTGEAAEPPYERHTGEVWAAAYSPDGRWIASAGTDRAIRLWRAAGRHDTQVFHGHTGVVGQLAFTPDGRRIWSVSDDQTARVWEADPKVTLPVLRGHTLYVYPVAYSPDGRWIASGSWDHTVRLWDAVTGEEAEKLEHTGPVRALAFGPDGSWLATGCDGDDRLRIWEVATRRARQTMIGPGKMPQSIALRPDGARLAVVDVSGWLKILDIATGQERFSTDLGGSGLRKVLAYSPDGRWLAVTGSDFDVCLRDAETNAVSARLSGHTGEIYGLAFSGDGRRLASVGHDRVVRVWDVDARQIRAELRGNTDTVFAAAFHPGGTRLATSGRDGVVWLWDLARREVVARLSGHSNYVWSLAFSPDGKTLASGSGDGTVRLWDTEPRRARHEARRNSELMRGDADRLVDRLLREKSDLSLVARSLEQDASLAEPLRRAAYHALLRRARANR